MASGRCAYHSYFEPQKRALMMMASSLSRAGSEEANRRCAPTRWTVSASSGLRSRTLKGPRAPPRGPLTIPSYARFCASVIWSRVNSGKRGMWLLL